MSQVKKIGLSTAQTNATVNVAGDSVTVISVPADANLQVGLGTNGPLTPVKTGDMLAVPAGFSFLRITHDALPNNNGSGFAARLFVATNGETVMAGEADRPNMIYAANTVLASGGQYDTQFGSLSLPPGYIARALSVTITTSASVEFQLDTQAGGRTVVFGYAVAGVPQTYDLRGVTDLGYTVYNNGVAGGSFGLVFSLVVEPGE